MEFTIGYSSKTFDGIISAGVMTVEADSIDTVREQAFSLVMTHYRDDAEDEDAPWHHNLQNLQVSVTESAPEPEGRITHKK